MKGVPAPRVQTVMMNLTRWLGVECAHCHVAGQFEKDDKPAKQTARNMFLMVRGINQNNFAGANPVTCWTCHRGEAKPQSLPPQ
jgi:photosynthetic reaction center cytochrome c subunit